MAAQNGMELAGEMGFGAGAIANPNANMAQNANGVECITWGHELNN